MLICKEPEGSPQGRKGNDRLANQPLIRHVQLPSFYQCWKTKVERENLLAAHLFASKSLLKKVSFDVELIHYVF